MGFIQNQYTKHFVKEANSLVDIGVVSSFKELADILGWDRTAMSNTVNGRRNVPNDIYKNFTERYKILPLSENGHESSKNDYTDDYIKLLKEKVEGFNSVEIEEKLAAILAYQKTFYHILAKLTAKVEKSSPGSVLSDMDKLLAGAFRDIRKTNISGVDNGTKV